MLRLSSQSILPQSTRRVLNLSYASRSISTILSSLAASTPYSSSRSKAGLKPPVTGPELRTRRYISPKYDKVRPRDNQIHGRHYFTASFEEAFVRESTEEYPASAKMTSKTHRIGTW